MKQKIEFDKEITALLKKGYLFDEFMSELRSLLEKIALKIEEFNQTKPWGAYVRFSDDSAKEFIKIFFGDEYTSLSDTKVSPKILIVKPGQKLSWQYHKRRAELWKFLSEASLILSEDDLLKPIKKAKEGEVLEIPKMFRHRLVGLDDKIVVVAELWRHTSKVLSDENDIIRLIDDYKR